MDMRSEKRELHRKRTPKGQFPITQLNTKQVPLGNELSLVGGTISGPHKIHQQSRNPEVTEHRPGDSQKFASLVGQMGLA